MSEEHPAAPAEPAVVPAVETPEPAPVETPPAPETPAEPAPAIEAETPAEPEIKPHTEEAGVLSAETEQKPAETPPEGEKPAEAPETPQEELKYEFKLPDGVEFAPEPLEKFTNIARELKIAPDKAQELVDLHLANMQAYDQQTLQRQHDAFRDMRTEWRNQGMADPDIGGSGYQTSVQAANRMLSLFTPPEHRAALNQALAVTGAADHPELLRLFANIAKKFDEPAPAPIPNNPPPGNARPNGAGAARIGYRYARGRGP